MRRDSGKAGYWAFYVNPHRWWVGVHVEEWTETRHVISIQPLPCIGIQRFEAEMTEAELDAFEREIES